MTRSHSRRAASTPFRRLWAVPCLEELEDRIAPAANVDQLFSGLKSPLNEALDTLVRKIENSTSKLPVIGESLGQAVAGAGRKVEEIIDGVKRFTQDTEAKRLLQDAFNALNGIGAAEIIRDTIPGAQNVVVIFGPQLGAVQVQMDLVREVVRKDIPFDFGLPAIPFKITNAGIKFLAEIRYDGLKFSLSPDNSFKLDRTQPDELKLKVNAGPIEGTSFQGNFGFLQASATVGPGTGLFGSLVVDVQPEGGFGAPRFAELVAGANLQVASGFNFDGAERNLTLPTIATDLVYRWDLSGPAGPALRHGGNRAQVNALGSLPQLSLNNVRIGLGTLLSGAVGPVVDVIQTVTKPFQPVLDVLNFPIPGVSDLGVGDVSLLKLANIVNDTGILPPPFNLIVPLTSGLVDLLTVINSIRNEPGVGVFVPIGSFNLTESNGDLRELPKARTLASLRDNLAAPLTNLSVGRALPQNLADFINGTNLPEGLKGPVVSALNRFTQPDFKIDLTFPAIDDPAGSAVKLLLGQDVDFARFRVQANLDFPFSFEYRLAGPLRGTLVGNIAFKANLDVRYDSFGLRKFLVSRKAEDLADGLAIATDQDLVYLKADVSAGPSLGFSLFSFANPLGALLPEVKVGPTLDLTASVSGLFRLGLNDPTPGDGKLRPFEDRVRQLFYVDGRLSASLRLVVACFLGPIKLGTLYDKTLAEVTLLDSTRIDTDNPLLNVEDEISPDFGGRVVTKTVRIDELPGARTTGAPNRIVIEESFRPVRGNLEKFLTITVNNDEPTEFQIISKNLDGVTELIGEMTFIGTGIIDEFIVRGVSTDLVIKGGLDKGRLFLGANTTADSITIDNRYGINPGGASTYTLTDGTVKRRALAGGFEVPLGILKYVDVGSVRLITNSTAPDGFGSRLFNKVNVLALPAIPIIIDSAPPIVAPPRSRFLVRLNPFRFDTAPPQPGGLNQIFVDSLALARPGAQLTVNSYSFADEVTIRETVLSNANEEIRYVVRADEVVREHDFPALRDNRGNVIQAAQTVRGRLIYNELVRLKVDHDQAIARGTRFNIESLAVGTETTLVGGAGNDVFALGGTTAQLDGLAFTDALDARALTVVGNDGRDVLFFDDSALADARFTEGDVERVTRINTLDYTVRNATVTRTNQVSLNNGTPATSNRLVVPYSSIEVLNILGGSTGDPFGLANGFETYNLGANLGAEVVVFGGTGPDRLNLIPFSINDPTVLFQGGHGRDEIVLDDQIDFAGIYSVSTLINTEINARGRRILNSDVERIELTTGFANDVVTISGVATGSTVAVTTRQGDDLIVVAHPQTGLDPILGTIQVDAGGDVGDSLSIQDGGGTAGRVYSVTDTRINVSGRPILYSGVRSLSLEGTGRNDEFSIGSTPTGVATTLTAASLGTDLFSIPNLNTIRGPLTLVTGTAAFLGGQTDRVTLGDAVGGAQNYTISADFARLNVRRQAGPEIVLQLQGKTALDFAPSSQGSTVRVDSTHADTAVNLSYSAAQPGTAVILGSDQAGTAALAGAVGVYATGNVQVVVNDSADQAARDFVLRRQGVRTFDTHTITGLTPQPIALELAPNSNVVVNGGRGADRVTVDFEQTALSWRINGGDGDDTFVMRNSPSAAAIRIDGGAGANTIDYAGYTIPSSRNGAVSWYKGEGNADDVYGDNPGVLRNGVTFGAGKVGQAFVFDGVDDVVEVANSATLNIANTLTLEAWIRPTAFNGEAWSGGVILGKAFGYQLRLLPSGQVMFYLPGVNDYIFSRSSVLLNEWTHVAGTYDGLLGGWRIYINGFEDIAVGRSGPIAAVATPLQIGAFRGDFGTIGAFRGLIDEATIYGRTLGAAEIRDIVALGSAGKAGLGKGVEVNLHLGTATGAASGVANIQSVIGSVGNDILVGVGVGVLEGRNGQDVLIAGAFTNAVAPESALRGGAGGDLLIGGRTDFDTDRNALAGLLAAWTSSGAYGQRVNDVFALLNGRTTGNTRTNPLFGEGDLDAFFSSEAEVRDQQAGESVI